MRKIVVCFLLSMMLLAGAANAASSPRQRVTMLINTVQKMVRQQASTATMVATTRVYLDSLAIAQNVAGRVAWRRASSAEKKTFIRFLEQQVTKMYASNIAAIDTKKIVYRNNGGEIIGRNAKVTMYITQTNGVVAECTVYLRLKAGRWVIHDFIYERISMVKQLRQRYQQQIQANGLLSVIQN